MHLELLWRVCDYYLSAVVCFETMGHACYHDNDARLEERTVHRLHTEGDLRLYAFQDTTLVYGPALQDSPELAAWTDRHFYAECYKCQWYEAPPKPWFTQLTGDGYTQWQGAAGDTEVQKEPGWRLWAAGQWCCQSCVGR